MPCLTRSPPPPLFAQRALRARATMNQKGSQQQARADFWSLPRDHLPRVLPALQVAPCAPSSGGGALAAAPAAAGACFALCPAPALARLDLTCFTDGEDPSHDPKQSDVISCNVRIVCYRYILVYYGTVKCHKMAHLAVSWQF